jgi:hypothetical protein
VQNGFQFSGNPFVDSGLAVMTHLAGKKEIADLTLADIKKLVSDGSALTRDNLRLKSFTMVFGTNGVLTQHAYKKIGKNEVIYKAIVKRLVNATENDGKEGVPCELTGIRSKFNFQEMCASALKEAGQKEPERKWIGRDWVPLAGSLGNDAQALPAASRPLHVSATALLALQYLPLGLFLHQGRLACYQCTHQPLMQELTADIVELNRVRMHAGDGEILGKGEGSTVLLNSLLERFGQLQQAKADYRLPASTALFLWLFDNSGTAASRTKPNCEILEIPDRVLHFLWDASVKGFSTEIRRLVAGQSKDPRQQFFTAIREQRDYSNLHAFKKWPGTSQEFYEFYQNRICGWSGKALGVARRVTKLIVEGAEPKRLKEFQKPDAFKKAFAAQNAVRRIISNDLSLSDYDFLFPSEYHPIRVKREGWDLIRFYLAQAQIQNLPLPESSAMPTTHKKIELIAGEYFRSRGLSKVKGLLDRLSRGKVGTPWLREIFCRMAELHPEFELGDWDEFVCDENGKAMPYEALFQIRLRLANLYRQSTESKEQVA